MNSIRPLIFISNDDGYQAKGLAALIKVATGYGDVVVVAPRDHQSGKSSAITVDYPLRAQLVKKEEGLTIYSVNGTPVDCTKLAIDKLLPRKPDVVLSGINHGYNSGNSTIYSGTMGVVFEGSFLGVPSVGFSYGDYSPLADFTQCEPIVRNVLEGVLANGLPQDVCLNVNIPMCKEIKDIKTVRAAHGRWTEEFEQRTDPHGRDYYWITGKYKNYEPDNDETDLYWLDRDCVTIVPCLADQTASSAIAEISAWVK